MIVSVIVLAFNHWDTTRQCLEALAAAELPDGAEVLLVDNGSTDETPEAAPSFLSRFRSHSYLRQPGNLVCSAALNVGARAARGHLLLFLNNDVSVRPRAVLELVETVHRDRQVAAAGAKLVYPGTDVIQHAGIAATLWGHPVNDGLGAPRDDARFNSPRQVMAVTGAMVAVRRSIFEATGGFEEAYRFGFEDVDLCLKIRARGGSIVYAPTSEATHHESLTVRAEDSRPEHNYELYRRRWGHVLEPAEEAYLGKLRSAGIRHVLVFGTGRASRLLSDRLERGGFTVVGFTDRLEMRPGPLSVQGKPVWDVGRIAAVPRDAILVGSQYFYASQDAIPPGARFPAISLEDMPLVAGR